MDLSILSPSLDNAVKKRKAADVEHEDAVGEAARKKQALEKMTENLNFEVANLCSQLQKTLNMVSPKILSLEKQLLKVDAATASLNKQLEERNKEKKRLNEEKETAVSEKAQLMNQIQIVSQFHGKSYFTLLIIALIASLFAAVIFYHIIAAILITT